MTGVRIRPGLCSVTFRDRSPDEIVKLCERAGIEAIEWGMDVHMPPGELGTAVRLARTCLDAGIETPTAGSYIRSDEPDDSSFSAVLETCSTLGAGAVRIWAGRSGSAEVSVQTRTETTARIARYAELAGDAGLTVSLEYHANTLTDTLDSTRRLLDDVRHPALTTYWQPRRAGPIEPALAELDALAGRLTHLHVFHWQDYRHRYPLADGRDFWSAVLERASAIAMPGERETRWGFLEFVIRDDPEQFVRDAATLRSMLPIAG